MFIIHDFITIYSTSCFYLGSRPPQARTSSMSEEDRKQNEMHQRERHLAAARANDANHR